MGKQKRAIYSLCALLFFFLDFSWGRWGPAVEKLRESCVVWILMLGGRGRPVVPMWDGVGREERKRGCGGNFLSVGGFSR